MKKNKPTIFGIGNPLIDVVIYVDEDDLIELELNKGTMELVNQERQLEIIQYFEMSNPSYSPGGSAPNTIIACAGLGVESYITGKIGNDKFGDIYLNQMKKYGVSSGIIQVDGTTGSSIILVTPDGERTMNTHLGLCREFNDDDIDQEKLVQSKYLYFTGYMWDTDSQKSAIKKAISIARQNDLQVVFDVADPFVVNRNKSEFLKMIKNDVDIIFANQPEIELLFDSEKIDNSINDLMKCIGCGGIKLGKEGSIIFKEGKKYKADASHVKVIDTTGAGDMFAAGFLATMARGDNFNKVSKIATRLAEEIIQINGAQFDKGKMDKIKTDIFSY